MAKIVLLCIEYFLSLHFVTLKHYWGCSIEELMIAFTTLNQKIGLGLSNGKKTHYFCQMVLVQEFFSVTVTQQRDCNQSPWFDPALMIKNVPNFDQKNLSLHVVDPFCNDGIGSAGSDYCKLEI